VIETHRLILKPLTYEQLIKYIKCDNSLEKELNLNTTFSVAPPDYIKNTFFENADNLKLAAIF